MARPGAVYEEISFTDVAVVTTVLDACTGQRLPIASLWLLSICRGGAAETQAWCVDVSEHAAATEYRASMWEVIRNTQFYDFHLTDWTLLSHKHYIHLTSHMYCYEPGVCGGV